jgi:MFS family permease
MNANNSKLWTKDFLLITLVNFFAAINFYLLMIVVADYAMTRFHSSPSKAGLSASIFIIGGLIARLFFGKWVGRMGYNKTLYAGALSGLVMTF